MTELEQVVEDAAATLDSLQFHVGVQTQELTRQMQLVRMLHVRMSVDLKRSREEAGL